MWETTKTCYIILLWIILPVLTEDERIITTLKYSKLKVELKSVKGKAASKGSFSYLVSIKRSFQKVSPYEYMWSNYCGGSIIQPMKVLTAAHCFELKNYYYLHHYGLLRVVAGSLKNNIAHTGYTTDTNGQQWRQISSVQLHKHFHFPNNDIALVYVDLPFSETRAITYVNPARSNEDYESKCYTAGFGTAGLDRGPETKISEKLIWAEIKLMSRAKCTAIWEMNMDQFLCSDTVFSDISGGDNGGPLVCSIPMSKRKGNDIYLLVGVASGMNIDKTRLYTRVSSYQRWIDIPEYNNDGCIRRCYIWLLCCLIKFACTCFDSTY